MTPLLGIIAAFIAFLAWGFGDFSAQRAVRKIGSLEVLFFSGLIGTLGLLPFVYSDLGGFFLDGRALGILSAAAAVMIVASFLGAEALRLGKISVVEPVISVELVLSAIIGVVVLGETLSIIQVACIVLVFSGVLLTITRRTGPAWWHVWRGNAKSRVEAGILFAVGAAVAFAVVNVLTSVSSKETSPVATIWFMNAGLTLVMLAWFVGSRRLDDLFGWSRQHWRPLAAASVLDNIAWLAYATAVTVIPVSVTVAMTESYIALAAVLGITITKEKLHRHQFAGLAITVIATIVLAVVSG